MSAFTIYDSPNRIGPRLNNNNFGQAGSSNPNSKVDFAEALAVLSNAANNKNSLTVNGSNSFSSDFEQEYFGPKLGGNAPLLESEEEVAAIAQESIRLKSIQDKFAVLEDNPVQKDWDVLEPQTQSDDFSILDKLGDGLMAAVKFAAGTYLGKLF